MRPQRNEMNIARRIILVLLLIFCCEVPAGLDGTAAKLSIVEKTLEKPNNRIEHSASKRFLKLVSGYKVDDDWTSPYVSSERREPQRVASQPILLLPLSLSELSEINFKPNIRKPFDNFEENERYSWQDHRDEWEVKAVRVNIEASNERQEIPCKRHQQKPDVRDPIAPSYYQTSDPPAVPNIVSNVPSGKLVEMFRAQALNAAPKPPIAQTEFDASERIILPDDEDEENSNTAQLQNAVSTWSNIHAKGQNVTPCLPNLRKALKVRAVLTVPLAGYSEPYTAWWDPVNGDARIHFQGGSTITFRKTLPNGLVQKVEMHVDRTEGRLVRCGVVTAIPSATDYAHPALPDLQFFTFSGYEFTENGQIERWQYIVSSPGDARGETITTHHEMLLTRDEDDFILPLRYRVSVNSTVLGPDSDGYEHLYFDAQLHKRGSKFFEPNIDEVCDQVEQLNANSPDDIARLEPLREFTMLEPNPHYTAVLERFKTKNSRVYADEVENVVRKNILTQTLRYVSSGNRAGATFEMGLNFLADRLDSEMAQLTGVEPGAADAAEKFPYTRPALTEREPLLPKSFDWRTLGGVSPVRFQGTSCASCWAFAVAGAVEGALFNRMKRLVPLSEQQLVDCAGPYGGNGCKGTWPSHAYDYIQNQGLSAHEEYTSYKAQVEQCKADTMAPITRISAHVNVTKYSVPALQVAIKENGPAVVILDSSAKSFQLYKKGVLFDERCSKKSAKHAVLAVGWGHKKGEPYFILKNSWSEAWGERGYVRVQARANTCGVLTHPSYPRLEDDDVLRTQ